MQHPSVGRKVTDDGQQWSKVVVADGQQQQQGGYVKASGSVVPAAAATVPAHDNHSGLPDW